MLDQLLSYTTDLWSRDPEPSGRMTVNELIARFGEQHVAAFILVLARVCPLFVLAPLFCSKLVPAARARASSPSRWPSALTPVVSQGATLPIGRHGRRPG